MGRVSDGRTGNFNPHTREGCDYDDVELLLLIVISIHTPVKGVTLPGDRGRTAFRISIHTPVKGVTSAACRCA